MTFFRRLLFNLWYLRKPPWDTGQSPPELLAFLDSHPPGSALDLGCGTGTNVVTMAQYGWQVTGVDFAARAVKKAKQRVKSAGQQAELYVDDVTSLSVINGRFDLILDIGCFHGLTPDGKTNYLQNIQRLLAAGGYYLMYGFFKQPDQSGTGLLEEDIALISDKLKLEARTDSTERNWRPSVWMTFTQRVDTL